MNKHINSPDFNESSIAPADISINHMNDQKIIFNEGNDQNLLID